MKREYSPTDDLQDLRAVMAEEELSAPERLVLVALILHRNGEQGRCCPSHPTLAAETGLGRSTVIRTLGQLEERELIERSAKPPAPTLYTVSLRDRPGAGPSRCEMETVPERDGDRPGAGPERTKERTKERTDELVGRLWAVFVDELDGGRLKLTKTRRRKLEELHAEQLQEVDDPAGQFRKILQAVKASDFHMGRREYQMPESLFRNEERRERWAMRARKNGRPSDPLMMTAGELRAREESRS